MAAGCVLRNTVAPPGAAEGSADTLADTAASTCAGPGEGQAAHSQRLDREKKTNNAPAHGQRGPEPALRLPRGRDRACSGESWEKSTPSSAAAATMAFWTCTSSLRSRRRWRRRWRPSPRREATTCSPSA